MRFIAIAACLIAPVQALALSCQKPSVEASYATAATSESTFLLGTGTLVFDQTELPVSTIGLERPRQITRIPATIKGNIFTGSGFDQEFETPVELVVRCIETWCPVVSSDKEHLVFLKETETKYELAIDPCGGTAFADPTVEMLNQVVACFEEGNCKVADPS